MEERKKPTRPFSVIYADAKQALTRQVGNTMAAYGLPIFMAEGILSGILAEIRTNAGNELADELLVLKDVDVGSLKSFLTTAINRYEDGSAHLGKTLYTELLGDIPFESKIIPCLHQTLSLDKFSFVNQN